MHFSIPDTQDVSEGTSSYTVFNLHINGVYHCSLRYRQLHSFHEQLKKEYGAQCLPNFPPKKLLSLTQIQLEERRLLLERYIQIVSQNQQIAASDTFNGFLLSAQQSSQQEVPEDVTLDVFLMNGHKITVNILSTDQTDDVLESVASQVQLADDFVYYFGLFLIKKEEGSDNAIVRKLQEFESPFISLKAANQNAVHRIVLRKSYWDPAFDDDLLEDRIAMNLIYVQAVNDIERGWVVASKDQLRQLAALQQRGSKKEYLRLARTLKCYGFLQFKPCVADIPSPGCRAHIAAGNRDLSFIIHTGAEEPMERSFKVTRMRCWRITTTMPEANGEASPSTASSKLELAFEYLVAKDTLKWITISSDQAILMSMCLQGMVDELIMKKQNRRIKRPSDRSRTSNGSKAASPIARSFTSSSLKSPSSPSEMSRQRLEARAGNSRLVKLRPLQYVYDAAPLLSQSASSTASHMSSASYAASVLAVLPDDLVFRVSPTIQDECSSLSLSSDSATDRYHVINDADWGSLQGSCPFQTPPLGVFGVPRMRRSQEENAGSSCDTRTSNMAIPSTSGWTPASLGAGTRSDDFFFPQDENYASGSDVTVSPASGNESTESLGSPEQEIREVCRQACHTDNVPPGSTAGTSSSPQVLDKLQRLEKKIDKLQNSLDVLMSFVGVAEPVDESVNVDFQEVRRLDFMENSHDWDERSSMASYVTV